MLVLLLKLLLIGLYLLFLFIITNVLVIINNIIIYIVILQLIKYSDTSYSVPTPTHVTQTPKIMTWQNDYPPGIIILLRFWNLQLCPPALAAHVKWTYKIMAWKNEYPPTHTHTHKPMHSCYGVTNVGVLVIWLWLLLLFF